MMDISIPSDDDDDGDDDNNDNNNDDGDDNDDDDGTLDFRQHGSFTDTLSIISRGLRDIVIVEGDAFDEQIARL